MIEKIKNFDELQAIAEKNWEKDRKIVFTNGCFDLLHVGHIRYLAKAKELGDVLIVALNSDRSVKKIKGATRPIIEENERMEVIAALEMVDYVTLFTEETCSHLLRRLKPDIYVKGGDYTLEKLPEWPVVRKYGGEVVLVKEVKGRSTSDIVNKIKGDQT